MKAPGFCPYRARRPASRPRNTSSSHSGPMMQAPRTMAAIGICEKLSSTMPTGSRPVRA